MLSEDRPNVFVVVDLTDDALFSECHRLEATANRNEKTLDNSPQYLLVIDIEQSGIHYLPAQLGKGIVNHKEQDHRRSNETLEGLWWDRVRIVAPETLLGVTSIK